MELLKKPRFVVTVYLAFIRLNLRTLQLQETHKNFLHAEKLSSIGKLSAS